MRPVRGDALNLPGSTTSAAEAIKLIEPALAGADGSYSGIGYSGVDVSGTIVSFVPKSGYVYRAMETAETSTGVLAALQNDTDGAALYGNVHDHGRFAFAAMPVARGKSTFIFIISEDRTIWRLALASSYVATFTGGATSSFSCSGTGAPSPKFLEGPVMTFPLSPPLAGFARMD